MVYRKHATFYTDAYAAYGRVIPQAQHRTVTKEARKTNHVERFNGTLRQRLSCLGRSALSFSKTLANHLGAIRYFLCHYNLTRAVTLYGSIDFALGITWSTLPPFLVLALALPRSNRLRQ